MGAHDADEAQRLRVERLIITEPFVLMGMPWREVYIHPLTGKGEMGLDDGSVHQIAGRESIFEPPTDGWLLHNMGGVIRPNGKLDILIASFEVVPVKSTGWHRVAPKRHLIGSGNCQRTVYEILGAGGPSLKIRCGETFNCRGGWSSWPPHSFDHQPDLAPQFEELFIPFLEPKDGSGMLRRKGKFSDSSDVDDVVLLESGASVRVPLGHHPIVAGPETDLMYFWAFVCPVDKIYRRLPDGRTEYA